LKESKKKEIVKLVETEAVRKRTSKFDRKGLPGGQRREGNLGCVCPYQRGNIKIKREVGKSVGKGRGRGQDLGCETGGVKRGCGGGRTGGDRVAWALVWDPHTNVRMKGGTKKRTKVTIREKKTLPHESHKLRKAAGTRGETSEKEVWFMWELPEQIQEGKKGRISPSRVVGTEKSTREQKKARFLNDESTTWKL